MLCRREKIKRNWLRAHQLAVEKSIIYATGPLPILEESKMSEVSQNQPQNQQNHLPNDFKFTHFSEERLKLSKEVINTNIIYNPGSEKEPKLLIKQLKKLIKSEKLKRHRPNPYAKFYLRRRAEFETSKLKSHKSAFNGSHSRPLMASLPFNGFSHSSSPLKNKPTSPPVNNHNRSPSSQINSNENSLNGKHVTRKDNQITLDSKASLDEIKREDKMMSPTVILTRASALVGYKIPKKKKVDGKGIF